MKFFLRFSLFMGLAVNRLKSHQLQPSAQLLGPTCLAGQALTEHLWGGHGHGQRQSSSEVSIQRGALRTPEWRAEANLGLQADPSLAAAWRWPTSRFCPLDKRYSHPGCTHSVFRELRKTHTCEHASIFMSEGCVCVCGAVSKHRTSEFAEQPSAFLARGQ